MQRNWIYKDAAGSEYGPYSRDELERYAREGRVSRAGQIQDPDGTWMPAHQAGLDLPADAPTAPTHPSTDPAAASRISRAGAQASPHNRIAYILLGILLPLCPGIAGINNLIVGRTGPGVVQLLLSMLVILSAIGIGCLAIPLYLGVLLWSVIEAATNDRDGMGRVMS